MHSAVSHSLYLASHTCVPYCSTCPLSKQGLGRPTMQACISMPCYLWVEQPCICTQSLVVNSVQSWWGIPACAQYSTQLFANGSLARGYYKVLLALHFSQGSPMCMCSIPTISALFLMWAVQHFFSSTLSAGGATLCEYIVGPYYLCTFSGQGSSAGKYHSI